MKIDLTHVLLFTLLLFGCGNAQRSLEKGNYEKAFDIALKELEKGKSVRSNKAVLQKSLRSLIEKYEQQSPQLIGGGEIDDWENALDLSLSLQNKIDASIPFIGNVHEETYTDIDDDEQLLRANLREYYLETAHSKLDQAIASGSKILAQQAYNQFLNAERVADQELPIDDQLQRCIQYGRINIRITADAPFNVFYNNEIDWVFDNVKRTGNNFLKVYYEEKGEDIDCEIAIDFRSLDIDFDRQTNRETFERRVQNGTRTVTDTSGNTREEAVFTTVQGEVTEQIEAKILSWEMDVDINSYTQNCDYDRESFQAQAISEIIRYEFYGDERAIPDEYRRINNRDQHIDEDDMVEELIEVLYDQFVDYYF